MFCDRCGTRLPDTAGFCPTCGKPARVVPLMPAQSRIGGHIRMLGILWLAISVFRLLPGLFLMSMFRHGGIGFLPPDVPLFVHGILRLVGCGPSVRRGGRDYRRVGFAGTPALGANACDRAGLFQPDRHALRHGAGNLYSVGTAAREVGRRISPDCARGVILRSERTGFSVYPDMYVRSQRSATDSALFRCSRANSGGCTEARTRRPDLH